MSYMSLSRDNNMILPWHIAQWKQLWYAKLHHRLPHALLLRGMAGMGKRQFADCFSRALLCQQALSLQINEKNDSPYCDTCHSCRLVASRTHPNVLWIEPEKEGHAIKVDQVRAISEFTQQSSWQNTYRIVIIHPADAMNINAANALLKTLEEPSRGSLIILVSDQASHLPATILSRCQNIMFLQPKREEALTWLKQKLPDDATNQALLLKLAYGAPLRALELIQQDLLSHRQDLLQALYLLNQKNDDLIKLANRLQRIDTIHLLDLFLTWMTDLIWLQLNVDADKIINQDFIKELLELKGRTQIKANAQLITYLQQLRQQVCSGINLNKLLLVECMLIQWIRVSVQPMVST